MKTLTNPGPVAAGAAALRSLFVRSLPDPVLFAAPALPAAPVAIAERAPARVVGSAFDVAILTADEAAAGRVVCGPYVYASTGPHGALWRRVR